MQNTSYAVRRLAFLGMMLAVIVTLSTIEHMLPPFPGLPPGIRPGLANIVTMYALFFMGTRSACSLTVLKSLFVLLMRGVTAGFLSLCGGLLSIAVILLLRLLFCGKISYLLLSIFGAVFHNLGQLSAASLLLHTVLVWYYLPLLLLGGVAAGAATGVLLRVVMPLFDRALPVRRP